jgi:hypothetical protein
MQARVNKCQPKLNGATCTKFSNIVEHELAIKIQSLIVPHQVSSSLHTDSNTLFLSSKAIIATKQQQLNKLSSKNSQLLYLYSSF